MPLTDAAKEKWNAYKKRWRAGRRSTERAQAKARYDVDPERHIAYVRKSEQANPERVKQTRIAHIESGAAAIASLKWRQAHPDRDRTLHRLNAKKSKGVRRERLRSGIPEPILPPETWYELARWGHTNKKCIYCRRPAECIDHFIPIARGGKNDDYNLVSSCNYCNGKKHDKLFLTVGAVKSFLRKRG